MGAAVAVILSKERHVVDAFERAGAMAPERAKPAADLGVDPEALAFRRLRRQAVIREPRPGEWYLDREVWGAVRESRRRLGLALLVAVLLAALLLGVFRGAPGA
jgi:hypothetical protein